MEALYHPYVKGQWAFMLLSSNCAYAVEVNRLVPRLRYVIEYVTAQIKF